MASYLGEFEQVVLLAALHLGDAAYGANVSSAIEERTGRKVSRGALYVTLDRLEDKGLIRSQLGDPSAARGGRPRRYVRVTASGVRALRESRAALMSLWQGLEDHLEAR